MATLDLFDDRRPGTREVLGPAACVLRGFALERVDVLLPAIRNIVQASPFRRMPTPGGGRMSAALTNCGRLGWMSDRHSYRYSPIDPQHGRPWPAMPAVFLELAEAAAQAAGFPGAYRPDACLINRYVPGARLGLHQDRAGEDVSAPIVSVSLGMQACFLFGGLERSDPVVKLPLRHGDVTVWGGPDRLRFHGIEALADDPHPRLGRQRINFSFRKLD